MAHQSGARSVLIIAHRTAATPGLPEEVRRRAAEGATRFTLLVPRPFWVPDTTLPERVSRWLHMDLPTRLHRVGLPVTVVTARKADRPLSQLAERAGR
jgi:hypothetical protein